MKSMFPVATRPLEYVAVFTLVVPTAEGPGHVFLAVDGFSEFAFHMGVERDSSPDSVLINIRRLLEDPNFSSKAEQGFTLVLGDFQELSGAIEEMIRPMKGKVLFSKKFNDLLSKPVRESLGERFSSKGRKD
jgi:hypothetical protein